MKVKRMIKSDVSTFKVGDIIKVRLTDDEKAQAMAVQQEEDGMVFCLVDCLAKEYPMNETRTNEGGYEASDLRKKLNGEILDRFPADSRHSWFRLITVTFSVFLLKRKSTERTTTGSTKVRM